MAVLPSSRRPRVSDFFSAAELQNAADEYEWLGQRGLAAKSRRRELEARMVGALGSCTPEHVLEAIANVYEWGYRGRSLPGIYRADPLRKELLELLSIWSNPTEAGTDAERALARILGHRSVGIATVSKFLCFIDQGRFAVLDSRVSLALMRVSIDGLRRYPVFPRRSTRNGPAVAGDHLQPDDVALTYKFYLRDLAELARLSGLSLCETEMALFQLGGPISKKVGRLDRDWLRQGR
jgi:hypothetical protein